MTNCTDLEFPGVRGLTERADVLVAPRAWSDGQDPNTPAIPRFPIPGPRMAPAPMRVPGQRGAFGRPAAEDPKPPPSIPGQRIPKKVPQQPIRNHTTGYTCCGHPMQQQGQQLVCGKCGSWVDPGVALAALALGGRA